MTAPLPLAGVRVLELGNFIAAPTAGRLLADFGAEVIKVERPGTGDELRRWRLHEGSETSLLFHTINRNKRSIALDLRTDEGRDAVRRLVAECDVVLENFRPGTLERWGIGPDVLDEARPGIVIGRISAFGQTGPLSARPGFAAVAEAMGGFRELVGDPDRPPVRVGVSIGDSIAGLYAGYGVMMALFQRETRRSAGLDPAPLAERVVDVALHEAMFSMTESLIPDFQAHGIVRERVGGRMEGIAPTNAYTCADGASIVIAGNADAIFQRLMAVIGRADLGEDAALASNEQRWARRDELDAAIGAWTTGRTAAEALAVLDDEGVPSGPIYTAADISASEQYAARDMIQAFDVEDAGGTLRGVGFPGIVPVLGGRSLPIRSLAPDLGQDTEEVLGMLRRTGPAAPSAGGAPAAAAAPSAAAAEEAGR
ncbi:formyl-CoA transferase [Rathayibacter sp. AY1C4]|uniref:CaiB/BaiF CoA transferase family protein n=1 Tax=Rathayibacter sp. AY1C4 TaxID=2080537 RepID=UPI000CE91239|nr:CoA transferase [Rathayibacter sp. AY1C4]PPH19579.1 formyl-CoA transferase [Rathayibacter sp. AY1C4]